MQIRVGQGVPWWGGELRRDIVAEAGGRERGYMARPEGERHRERGRVWGFVTWGVNMGGGGWGESWFSQGGGGDGAFKRAGQGSEGRGWANSRHKVVLCANLHVFVQYLSAAAYFARDNVGLPGFAGED